MTGDRGDNLRPRTQQPTSNQTLVLQVKRYRQACLLMGLSGVGFLALAATLFACLGPAWTKVALGMSGNSSASVDRRTFGKPGPWGDLEYTRIVTEIPDDLLILDKLAPAPCWFFGSLTADQLVAFFRSTDLTEAERASLIQPDKWEIKPEGIRVYPSVDLVLGLNRSTRQRIYTELAHFKENAFLQETYTYRPELLNERLADCGLRDESIALFRRLLYPQGPFLLLADTDIALSRLADVDERKRFVKMASRKASFLVKLRVHPDSDIESLCRYWGRGGRAKDICPLLKSVSRVPGGCPIDIVHLLPPLARQRLYTYPPAFSSAQASSPNCYWTALNFFNTRPDDRFLDDAWVAKTLQADYKEIPAPSQLGDLILLEQTALGTNLHSAFHAAVYIADDLVFTKNGSHFTQPWILMKLSDMIEIYSGHYPPDQPIKITYARAKQ